VCFRDSLGVDYVSSIDSRSSHFSRYIFPMLTQALEFKDVCKSCSKGWFRCSLESSIIFICKRKKCHLLFNFTCKEVVLYADAYYMISCLMTGNFFSITGVASAARGSTSTFIVYLSTASGKFRYPPFCGGKSPQTFHKV